MIKDKINQILDYFIGKVLDVVIVKVNSGALDVLIQQKVDALVTELTTTP